MTRRQIIAALTAFTLIGVVVVVACAHSVVTSNSTLGRAVPASGILFIVVIVTSYCMQAIRELRRKRSRDS